MSPLIGPGVSLTFPKGAPNIKSSNPHSKVPAIQYKAANTAYNKQYLVVQAIDDLADMKKGYEVPEAQNDVRIYKEIEIYCKERKDASMSPVFSSFSVSKSSRVHILNGSAYSGKEGWNHTDSSASLASTPTPAVATLLVALMQPKPSGAADLDAWYRTEHNQQMSKEPGWLRTCRYELVSHSSDDADAKLAFLAIHEFGEGEQLGDVVKALQPVSDWTKRVMNEAVGIDAAIYRRV